MNRMAHPRRQIDEPCERYQPDRGDQYNQRSRQASPQIASPGLLYQLASAAVLLRNFVHVDLAESLYIDPDVSASSHEVLEFFASGTGEIETFILAAVPEFQGSTRPLCAMCAQQSFVRSNAGARVLLK